MTSRTFNGSIALDGDADTHVLFVHLVVNPGKPFKWILTDSIRLTPEEIAASGKAGKEWKAMDKVELPMRPDSVKKVIDWLAKRDLSVWKDILRAEMARLKAEAESA